jgi:hypothetical protein
VGSDGRNVYTKDPDARAGYRTGNANHPGGSYIGREAHFGVAVPKLVNTDTVRWAKFGPDVAPFIVTADLVPAGTHRAKAVIDSLIDASRRGLCGDVIADGGYTVMNPTSLHLPLQRAGIGLTMRPSVHQRGEKPGVGAARLVDGHLFAAQLPNDLVDLPLPPRGASNDAKKPYTDAFERRAAYRYGRIKAPGADGTTRWQHPVKTGTLRSRKVPRSMRHSTTAPLIELEDGVDLASVTAGADALPHSQRCLLGTTAWHQSMGRRQLAETANSQLHGAVGSLTDISRGYTKLRDSGRINMFFYATLAGYNHLVADRWRHDHGDLEPTGVDPTPKTPRRRGPRRGRARRYDDLPVLAGPAPPR